MAYDADRCLACHSSELITRPALVSPFLSRYLFNGTASRCRFAECTGCGLQFFDRRLSSDEITQLYRGYRGRDYFQARHGEEFWYTRRHNDNLGSDVDIAHRLELLRRTLEAHCDPAEIAAVLDYGGDRGQILAEGPGSARYVFDLSGAEPIPGVRKVAHERELDDLDLDLILLCEVLEHASDPVEMLRAVVERLKPGGLVFITVPSEQLRIGDIPAGGWYERYLDSLSAHPKLLSFLDFYSTVSRVKLQRIPPLGFAKMHEHLSLFAPEALRRTITAAGLAVLVCEAPSPKGPIVALGRRGRPN